MAYVSQEMKKERAPAIKAVLKKFGIKGSIAVRNYSTLVVNIREGAIDFANDRESVPCDFNNPNGWRGYDQVNTYHIDSFYTGKAREFLSELKAAMNVGNYDNSDIMTDYFDVGFYIDINVGRWDREYKFNA